VIYGRSNRDDAGGVDGFAGDWRQFRVQATARPDRGSRRFEKEWMRSWRDFGRRDDGGRGRVQRGCEGRNTSGLYSRRERIGGFGGKSDRLAQSEVFAGSE